MKVIYILLLAVFLINLVSGEEYCNYNLPSGQKCSKITSININATNYNVNDSLYWNGHAYGSPFSAFSVNTGEITGDNIGISSTSYSLYWVGGSRIYSYADGLLRFTDSIGTNSASIIVKNITAENICYSNGTGCLSENPMTTYGDMIYGGTGGIETRLPPNNNIGLKFLSQGGNGTDAFAPTWQTVPAQGAFTYYFHNDTATPNTYKNMTNEVLTSNLSYIQQLVSADTNITQWITSISSPGLTSIPSGIWRFHIDGAIISTLGNKNAHIYFTTYAYNGSAERLLFKTQNSDFITTTDLVNTQELDIEISEPTISLNSTDRIIVRVTAGLSGAGNNPTIRLYWNGNTVSRVEFPSATVDSTNFVPYIGATQTVNLDNQPLIAGNTRVQNLTSLGNVTVAGIIKSGGAITSASTIQGNGLISTGAILASAGDAIKWNGRSQMTSPSDSKILLRNAAGTDFSMLLFGGTTSAFPALKRSGAGLIVRLADDSANAKLTASELEATSIKDGQVVFQNDVGGGGFIGSNGFTYTNATETLNLNNLNLTGVVISNISAKNISTTGVYADGDSYFVGYNFFGSPVTLDANWRSTFAGIESTYGYTARFISNTTGGAFMNVLNSDNSKSMFFGYSDNVAYTPVPAYLIVLSGGGTLNIVGDSGNPASIDVNNMEAESISVQGIAGITDCYDSIAGGQVCGLGGELSSVTDDPSDKMFKTLTAKYDADLSKFNQLNLTRWDWTMRNSTGYGFVAQDVERIYPEFVKEGKKTEFLRWEYKNVTTIGADKVKRTWVNKTAIYNVTTFKTIDYTGIIGLQTEKIKELEAKVNNLDTRLRAIEGAKP